uniref:Uncharacterized protein n=1 Tax=Candidatus Methanophagaceae archaeon ANME-1 ERB6 TaxID=2759912 RepID=A0A7G9Z0J1_9EURY|nr:hypothetical protein JMICBFOL_00024 [Methanosarcinales archaeon ANME-1 ERB6]
MGASETFEKVIMDWRTLAVIAVVTILWRTVVSLDKQITLWESVSSGVVLIILGWFIFSYLYLLSKRETSWLISNKMAQGIAVTVSALNVYVLVYYAMRWYRLMTETEIYVPRDYLMRDVRYAMLVLAYCGIIWATGHLRKMHDNYMLVTKDMPERRKAGASEVIFSILTDERSVIVILGAVFLWRAVISFDKQIVLWESMCSGMAIIMLGWILLGYISSLSVRTTRPTVAKIYQGFAFALLAVNMYALVYYGMRWYRLIFMPASEEALIPLDFVLRDIRYFVLVIFYCTSIVLSKYLERASEECEFLIKKGEKEYKE